MKPILSGIPMSKIITCFLLLSNILSAQTMPGDNSYPVATGMAYLPANFASGIKVNYVRTTLLLDPVTVESNIQPTNYDQTRIKTKYADGLGRIIQTVDHFQSPEKNDVVNVVKYDNLGRDAKHFLPYSKQEGTAADNGKFKMTPYSDQTDFYKYTMGYNADNFFYTQTNYEPSPLNRVIKQLPQGNSWVGSDRGTTITENPLPAGMNIRFFTIDYASTALPVTSSVYAAGDLMITTTTDEDGYFTEEYKTKNDLLVLKATGKTGNAIKLLTYYVYDDFGLLRFVIPPKATVYLATNNWTMPASIASGLCYRYTYDGRSRMIIKDIPGAGSQYIIYNNKDQMIFTQTALQAAKGEYLFSKYDVLGRLIQSGVYNSTATPSALQALVNANNNNGDTFLSYMYQNTYGNSAYTSVFTTAKVLVTNYYDDYSFTSRTYDGSVMNKLPVGWNTTKSDETTNLLTGSKVVVLDGAATPTELLTVNFYNDRGLLLQAQAQNHKGGWNIITNSYDFIGEKIGTYTDINNPQATDNTTIKTLESFYYDNAGRMLSDMHSLNGAPIKPVIRNNLDELARIDNKNFSNGAVPTVKYEYNVRNWLTAINKDYCYYLSNSDIKTFGMEISYDYGYNKQYFNGNIAGIKWRNSGNPMPLRSYGYNYDSYNRLTSGDYMYKLRQIDYPSGWENTVQDFTASNMTYDENGNIKSMKQLGLNTAGQKIILDDLTYSYYYNKLNTINESAASQSKDPNVYDGLGDFRDMSAGIEYNYDANGNLTNDINKRLAYTYNELINKTQRVSKGTLNVDYLYDALGNKLQKKTNYDVGTTTDYIGTAVYINNKLSFINHPEGRIRYNATSATPYMYDYFIKDHLGSTRSVITITDGGIAGFAKSEATKSNEVKYVATSEPDNAAKENQLFDNIDNTRSLNVNKKTEHDNYVAKIYSSSSKTILGPDITIKVMAGDSVKISAEALYIAEKNNPKEVAQNAITNFVTAFIAPMGLTIEALNKIANNGIKNLASSALNIQNEKAKNESPKAFLNYILYDQYMNLIAEGSGAIQVKEKDGWQTLETEKMTIPQNGFLRVFTNNMGAAPVNINNTTLAVVPSKLVEEYNYYPYGLVFGASSAASSIKKTDYLYNGKELQHNEFGQGNGLELEDYGARMYDPQIGKWNQVDPLGEKFSSFTPYNYCLNNPINMIDLNGMESTYNWETKKYENEKGQEVSWGNVQKEYGINQNVQDVSSNVDQDGDDKKKGQSLAPTNNIAQGGGGMDVSGLSTTNGWFGTAVGFGEISTLAGQGRYITSKGLIRDINFAKLTKHSVPYANAGKILKSWGRASVGIGVAVDSYSWWNGQISGAKFGLNTGVTAWGLGLGAAGMAVPAFIGGTMYFGIDTFYPGGWNGAMNDQSNLNKANSFNPYWQLWPGALKQ